MVHRINKTAPSKQTLVGSECRSFWRRYSRSPYRASTIRIQRQLLLSVSNGIYLVMENSAPLMFRKMEPISRRKPTPTEHAVEAIGKSTNRRNPLNQFDYSFFWLYLWRRPFSYFDPSGQKRTISYTAGKNGYVSNLFTF